MNFAGPLASAAVGMLAWLCAAVSARADLNDGPPAQITATVTAKMGDVGGKFFGKIPDAARTRHYYVAAESDLWDYAPLGRDVICGKPFPPAVEKLHANVKTRYVEYTDATFQTKVRRTPSLGIMGPVLRGVVGDYLAVTFLNRTLGPLSMHPHGVRYDKDSEGAFYLPEPGRGAAVGQGAKFTYVWQLDETSGPLPGEPSSKAWLYHSHVAGDEEIQNGLMGCIIVTDPRRARPDGSPNDVDRELATLYLIFNESGVDRRNPPGNWARGQELMEQGYRYAINGFIFGNLPALEMNEGERVRWYVLGLGSDVDMHTAHWHGMRVVEDGRRRTDVVELLPATMKVADMTADNPGSWLMHCHVSEHMQEGMFARVTVHPKSSPRAPQSKFLGLGAAVQSLQITRAEVSPGPTPEKDELHLQGTVTVTDAFGVLETAVTLRAGDKTFAFHLDKNGRATSAGSSFQVMNANRAGIVPDGLMEFTATLMGNGLQGELQKAGGKLPITMQVDAVAHSTDAQVTSLSQNR